jgi:hypothetical protein
MMTTPRYLCELLSRLILPDGSGGKRYVGESGIVTESSGVSWLPKIASKPAEATSSITVSQLKGVKCLNNNGNIKYLFNLYNSY